jgi:hypothetical protein
MAVSKCARTGFTARLWEGAEIAARRRDEVDVATGHGCLEDSRLVEQLTGQRPGHASSVQKFETVCFGSCDGTT